MTEPAALGGPVSAALEADLRVLVARLDPGADHPPR